MLNAVPDDATHRMHVYANHKHDTVPSGALIVSLWFRGEPTMQMDLDIALKSRDVAYVDVIDCEKNMTERHYPAVLE